MRLVKGGCRINCQALMAEADWRRVAVDILRTPRLASARTRPDARIPSNPGLCIVKYAKSNNNYELY